MKASIWKFFLPLSFLLIFSCNDASIKISNPKEKKVSVKDTLASLKEAKDGDASSWKINEGKSKINFSINNFGNKVDGTLGGLKGTIAFNPKKPEAGHFNVSAKLATINTGNKKRDADLMHEKYFDESKYPEIIFRSKKITRSGKGYTTTGNLTMKGVTHEIMIPFDFEEQGNTGTFLGKIALKRLDYHIGGKGPIMGKEVQVQLKVVAQK